MLFGPAVANGDWWRLITSAFLHANILHIGLNMLAIGWLGVPVERYVGHLRYLGIYMVSGLAGSAGALIMNPNGFTVGASGAVFGILGALLIIEYQQTGTLAGQAFTLIVINLAVFVHVQRHFSRRSHRRTDRRHRVDARLVAARAQAVAYGRPGLAGVAALVAVGALSVAVAYWKVKGYA